MRSRKGSTKDLTAALKMIGPVMLTVFLGATMYFEFSKRLYQIPIISSEAKMIFGTLDTAILAFDWLAPFFMVGMMVGSLYLAHRIPASPIFLPFSIILGLFSIYMSAQLSNLWIEFARAPFISDTVGRYVNTEALLLHIPHIMTGWWIILLGVMYKSGSSGGGVSNPIR